MKGGPTALPPSCLRGWVSPQFFLIFHRVLNLWWSWVSRKDLKQTWDCRFLAYFLHCTQCCTPQSWPALLHRIRHRLTPTSYEWWPNIALKLLYTAAHPRIGWVWTTHLYLPQCCFQGLLGWAFCNSTANSASYYSCLFTSLILPPIKHSLSTLSTYYPPI